jgi:hypothetical protein
LYIDCPALKLIDGLSSLTEVGCLDLHKCTLTSTFSILSFHGCTSLTSVNGLSSLTTVCGILHGSLTSYVKIRK